MIEFTGRSISHQHFNLKSVEEGFELNYIKNWENYNCKNVLFRKWKIEKNIEVIEKGYTQYSIVIVFSDDSKYVAGFINTDEIKKIESHKYFVYKCDHPISTWIRSPERKYLFCKICGCETNF